MAEKTDSKVVVFQGGNISLTKDQYDTFVASISTQQPTKEEINLHLWYCDSKGVNPLDKLIYFTKRQGRYTPVTGIDFMRVRAESSGAYAGSDDPEFFYEKDSKADGGIHSAKVTVYKMVGGQRCPFSATARWSEYAPADIKASASFMWRKMPHTMLGKCAEALALRKAFPGQLHGLYASEEMAQDGRFVDVVDVKPAESVVDAMVSEVVSEYVNATNENQDNPAPETTPADEIDAAYPPVAQAAKELADGFTPKQIKASAEIINQIKALSGSDVPHILKHVKTLDPSTRYTIGQIVNQLKVNQLVGE